MKFNIIAIFLIFFLMMGCQTIKEKTEEMAKKENEKLSQFIGKPLSELKSELGNPTDDYVNETGVNVLVYKTKKYGIPCKRKFEVNSNGIITGFVSSGCF